MLPELWGGSADLAGSNNTTIKGADSFGPTSISTEDWNAQPYGRTLHFGIREHAMGSILNGIVLHGKTRPYAGTFLQFADYMRPAVRLAALMDIDPIYVWTHDSVGLGEDGPTHQPIEHLAALRAIPGLDVVRPADANETAHAWRQLLTRRRNPVGLALTRQNVPVLEGTSFEGVARGGYVLSDGTTAQPDVVLIAPAPRFTLAVDAAEVAGGRGRQRPRRVSMPCLEWFDEQTQSYRESVLPPTVSPASPSKQRIAHAAGTASGRRAAADRIVEHFGASAGRQDAVHEFGFTAEAVAGRPGRAARTRTGPPTSA